MTLTINPMDDLGMQIEKALHPILSAAEEEETKQPTRIEIPKLKYREEIVKIIQEHNTLWETWADESNVMAESIVDYREAVAADDLAIRKAAEAGAAKHPGRAKSEKAAENLEWATAKCRAARAKCSALADGRVERLIEGGLDGYVDQIRRDIDTARAIMQNTIENARRAYNEAAQNVITQQSALDFIQPMVDKRWGYHYSPNHGDQIPNVGWPDKYSLGLPWATQHLDAIDRHRGRKALPPTE